MYKNLIKYGLSERFSQESTMYEGMHLARITQQHREIYRAASERGELMAAVSGKLLHTADGNLDFPAVGDWVMLDRADDTAGNAVIHHILQRKSVFTRMQAGSAHAEQVIAANIDTVFICMSLNSDFNLRRVERYLAIAWESRAKPVIVLTKADLCADLQEKLNEISTVSLGCDVVACSSMDEGYHDVEKFISEGETVAFIGSSGVGKSTLINRLVGSDVLTTSEIRVGDDKGRHTTTHRQLLVLPDGGIVIDTPGMRELQLFSGDVSKAFEDIEGIAATCKFKDCSHAAEPGCAIREAIESGALDGKRYENYVKLQREISYEGLNSRQLEQEKLGRMFGSKGEMKQMIKHVKNKNRHH